MNNSKRRKKLKKKIFQNPKVLNRIRRRTKKKLIFQRKNDESERSKLI